MPAQRGALVRAWSSDKSAMEDLRLPVSKFFSEEVANCAAPSLGPPHNRKAGIGCRAKSVAMRASWPACYTRTLAAFLLLLIADVHAICQNKKATHKCEKKAAKITKKGISRCLKPRFVEQCLSLIHI